MSVNPYESPRIGDPPTKQTLGDSDTIRQLLTEIRDQQAELLALQRAAMQRQQNWSRFVPILLIAPLVMVGFSFYRLWMIPRPTIPRPARTAPANAPLVPPPAAPTAS
jgi:hypothetical protein